MRKTEIGRSMTEMLGVLAIIGVLIILFIWGYRTAVNKNKANETIHDAHLIAATLMSNHQFETAQKEDYLTFDESKNLQSGYTFKSKKETDAIFSIIALDVPKGVCKKIIDIRGSDYFAAINNDTYFDINEQNKCQETNKVNFYFDTTDAKKCAGRICYGGRQCVENKCQCSERQLEENGACKCLSSYPNACEGDCYAACPGGSEFNCKTKECVCTETTHIFKNGRCVCPSGKEEGADGKCHTKSCSGGTADNRNWTCHIDDERCGYQCSENGLQCNYGVCDKGICPAGTTHVYHAGKKVYGCINSKDITCMPMAAPTTIYCYLPTDGTNACCGGKLDGTCTYGLCDATQCPEETTYFGKTTVTFTYGHYGCWKEDNSLQCSKSSSYIMCATPEGVICGTKCQYDGHCTISNFCPDSRCQENESWSEAENKCIYVCPEGTTHTTVGTKNRCTRDDGVYCELDSNNAVYCRLPNGRGICGSSCRLDGTNCPAGICDASECEAYGLSLKHIEAASAGCYDPDPNTSTGIACYPQNLGRTRWTCLKNGKRCAGVCTDPYGTDCCEDFVCPAGTIQSTTVSGGYNYNTCYNPANTVTCFDNKNCYRQGMQCGTGCNFDGTGCTSTKKCVESECGTGKTLAIVNGAWACATIALSCTDGTCTMNGSKCGTGCNSEGKNCSYGICSETECESDTYLSKVDTNTFGCRNSSGIVCYKEDGKYTCQKNGAICATECDYYTQVNRYGCTTDTCNE